MIFIKRLVLLFIVVLAVLSVSSFAVGAIEAETTSPIQNVDAVDFSYPTHLPPPVEISFEPVSVADPEYEPPKETELEYSEKLIIAVGLIFAITFVPLLFKALFSRKKK